MLRFEGPQSEGWGDVHLSRRDCSHLDCHVLVDFDGTIASVDTTDLLLEQFADPAWHAIEDDWKAGKIGSRECLARQIDLIRATPAEIDAFISNIEIDPGFPAFVAHCRAAGHRVTVVSDGLDRTVGAVLRQAGIDLPYFANHFAAIGEDRWRLTFPHARSDCRPLSGNCKCQFADAANGPVRIVVGDGRSDFCVAERADLVLAKSSLLRHCRSEHLPHQAFTTFDEATRLLAGWLTSPTAAFASTLDARRND
ncbi:MAG: MtnX-like HAD-IB family phosphatase [Steroidobacteraceae bacterium]